MDTENSRMGGVRLVDRFDSKLVNIVTVVGFAIPVIGYFWVVYRYGVNVMIDDQLSDLTVINASYSHLVPWGALWTQHSESRLFFPNLIVIVQARTDHFNIHVEEFLSAFMLLGATALIIWAHKRRAPSTPWVYYCPVAFLTFSLAQYQSTLWGFQMCWYLVLLSLASTIFFLDRIELSWPTFGLAVTTAVIGSFSSFQGLLIWAAGLLLLYQRRRRPQFLVTWIAFAAASALLYFHNWSTSSGSPDGTYALRHLWSALEFFAFLLGDVVGIHIKSGSGGADYVLFGLVILLVTAVVLVTCGIRRDELSGCPVGLALICFGLLFAASTTQGRAFFGLSRASDSEYTTFDLLVLIGLYLTLLERPLQRFKNRDSKVNSDRANTHRRVPLGMPHLASESLLRTTGWVVAGIVVVQVLLSFQSGLQEIPATHKTELAAAAVSRSFEKQPNGFLVFFVNRQWQTPRWDRQQLAIAKKHRLSLFVDDG